MPTTIGFFNVEKWSDQDILLADAALAEVAAQKQRMSAGVVPDVITRAVTRAAVKEGRYHPYDNNRRNMSRVERAELLQMRSLMAKESKANIKKKKAAFARNSIGRYDEVFYCEVVYNHPAAKSPLYNNGPITQNLNCYASYNRAGIVQNFTHILSWPMAMRNGRVPAYRVVAGTGLGGPVNCYFWHAPSRNNGSVVVRAYQHLLALGGNFILFGDLNAEPDQIAGPLKVPRNNIIEDGPTRISGRTLDYAITNVPGRVKLRKYDGIRNNFATFKKTYGSDHAFMVMELT